MKTEFALEKEMERYHKISRMQTDYSDFDYFDFHDAYFERVEMDGKRLVWYLEAVNVLPECKDEFSQMSMMAPEDSIPVEAIQYDDIWGIKMGQTDENILNPWKWKGENLLEFALMEVRDEIRRVWKNADICDTVII